MPDVEGTTTEADGLSVQTFACVWDALTDSPAEAATMRLCSDLLSAIGDTVESWTVTRLVAARHLDLTPPRLDELLGGSVGKFSINELIELATRAGLDVRVQVRPAETRRNAAVPKADLADGLSAEERALLGRRSARCAGSVARPGSTPATVRMSKASGGPGCGRLASTRSSGWRAGSARRRCTGRNARRPLPS